MDDLSDILGEIAAELDDPAPELPPMRLYVDRHGVTVQIRTRRGGNKVATDEKRASGANKGLTGDDLALSKFAANKVATDENEK